jgi:hypothetical protein
VAVEQVQPMQIHKEQQELLILEVELVLLGMEIKTV